MIRLRESESGVVEVVEINGNGDRIFYRGSSDSHYLTFEIANYDSHSESMEHGLPSSDRLRSYARQDLSSLSGITGIPLADLVEIRDLEITLDLPKPG